MNIHRRKNTIKMDSFDVHVHPIQFQLYDKESFWIFDIIKNIFRYNTILFLFSTHIIVLPYWKWHLFLEFLGTVSYSDPRFWQIRSKSTLTTHHGGTVAVSGLDITNLNSNHSQHLESWNYWYWKCDEMIVAVMGISDSLRNTQINKIEL